MNMTNESLINVLMEIVQRSPKTDAETIGVIAARDEILKRLKSSQLTEMAD